VLGFEHVSGEATLDDQSPHVHDSEVREVFEWPELPALAKLPVNPFAKCRGSCAREYSGESSTLSTPTALKRPLEEPGLRSPQGDPWNRTASAEEIMRAGSHESRRVTGKELLEICLSATTMRVLD
jgi:hypothetical protein